MLVAVKGLVVEVVVMAEVEVVVMCVESNWDGGDGDVDSDSGCSGGDDGGL